MNKPENPQANSHDELVKLLRICEDLLTSFDPREITLIHRCEV